MISCGVTAIEERAFENCSSLQHIEIPESVQKIGSSAFFGCSALANIHLPEGIVCIEDGAFSFSSLETISIPASVHTIGMDVFVGCNKLKEVVIPDTVKQLGDGIFGKSSVVSVTMPLNTRRVSRYSAYSMFGSCKALRSVWFTDAPEEGNEPIAITKKNAFENCCDFVIYAPKCPISAIENAKIPAVIGFAEMMEKNEAIEKDIVQEYDKYISAQKKKLYPVLDRHPALLNYMLGRKMIPLKDIQLALDSVQTPEAKAAVLAYQDKHFSQKDRAKQNEKEIREALKEPTPLAELKKIWQTKKLEDGTLAIISYKGDEADVVVPDKIGPHTVTVIGEYAFSSEKPRLPAELKELHQIKLKSVTLPEGIVVIEGHAFHDCRALQSVTLPNTLKCIGEYAFSGSGIATIEIPSSVETVNRLSLHFSTVSEVIVSSGVGTLDRVSASILCSKQSGFAVPIPSPTIS